MGIPLSAMFNPTSPLLGGLLWKIPWRLSSMQKARQRKRLKLVDKVVDTVSIALQNNGGMTTKAVERWYKEMPREEVSEGHPQASEVDESQPESQSAWFLDAAEAV